MSKVVKGVAIGAAVGVTAGLLLPAFGVATIAGTAITLTGAAIAGAVYGGLQGAALQFAKKPQAEMGPSLGRLNLSIDPQAPGTWVFGETPCATDIIFAEQIGDEVVAYVVAAAAHEIDSFGELYINDELVPFSGTAAGGDWSGVLIRATRTGAENQTAITIPDSTKWEASSAGAGIAHYSLRFDASNDGENKLGGGIPTRITQVVKGSKVYDPRLDSTRGGDGAHRVGDQSTWEWSDNWALIVAHYLLGYRNNNQLIYGVGVSADDIDWPQVIAMANVCDETVDGKPRYRVGGIIPTTQDHAGIIGQLEAAIDGKVSKIGGKYYIWAPHNDLIPSGVIDDSVVLREAGVSFTPSGPIGDLFNTARGRYIDPDTLYQPVPYPEAVEPDAVTEDTRARVMEREFAMIQDDSIAQRVAREMIRRSRFSASWTLALGPGGLAYQPFSVVTINLPETDNTDVLARVIDMEYSPEGIVVLTLREEDASIYDTTIPLGTSFVQDEVEPFDPSRAYPVQALAAVAIAAVGSGGTRSDAFRVSWALPGRFVQQTEVRYRIAGDDDYSYVDTTRISEAIIVPVEPQTLYDIEARHISTTGVVGPFASIQQTSGNNARSVSISGSVEYSQSNTWIEDGTQYTPPGVTVDATFTFKRRDEAVATRVIRGTLNQNTGQVTATNLSSSGEDTSFSVVGDGTAAVLVSVTHDDSGVQVVGQFLVLSDADLTALQQDLNDLNDDLDTLENVTLPALQSELDTLENVTLPALQSDIDTLNNVTLPALQQELDDVLPITETKISNDAISSPKLQANSVIAGKIAANAVTANTIAAGAVIAGKIGADAVTANEIAAGSIITSKIGADAVTANEIAAGSIITSKIGAGAVTANEIAAGTITANELSTGTLITQTAQIANGIITTAKIGQAQIDTLRIGDNAVTIPESNGGNINVTLSNVFLDIGNSLQIAWGPTFNRPSRILLTGVITIENATGNNNVPVEAVYIILSGSGSILNNVSKTTLTPVSGAQGFGQLVINSVITPTSPNQITILLRARQIGINSLNITARQFSTVALGAKR